MNAHRTYLIRQEADRIRKNPFGFDNRATIAVARQVLLDGTVMSDGVEYEPRSKHLGVGVYQITFEEKEFRI